MVINKAEKTRKIYQDSYRSKNHRHKRLHRQKIERLNQSIMQRPGASNRLIPIQEKACYAFPKKIFFESI